MRFANPQLLWLLLVFLPAMIAFFWWSRRKQRSLIAQFIQTRLLADLLSGVSAVRQRIRLGCLVAAVACVVLALARPQWGFSWQEIKQRGLDIVVAVDTSKSMLAEDISPNRLARAKLAALDLMKLAKSDRLGLVAFAGIAFLQCPLTIDDVAFRQSVESLDVNIIPQGGTALAEAIETALGAFKEGDNYKVLVLFTDGEDHDSGALEAAQQAAKQGLRIFTIGIGTAEGELLKYKNPQGVTDYIRDEQGNVVKSHLNETLLQQIAGATERGFYLPLRGAKTIETLYDQGLATLPKSQHQERLVKQYYERFYWPLAAAILLLLAEMLLPERKPGPRPKPSTAGAAPAALRKAVALALLLACPVVLPGSPSSALREYKAGKYDQALKEYQQLLERKADDPRLNFNAGAAAYRNQQFDEAATQFGKALSTPDLKLQELSYYNRGNSLYHLGEANPDPAKRTETWQKSLQDFEHTLTLNPKDGDAQFNRDFVKKRLEELKQQQQQQQQNKKDQNQNQDQQQQNQPQQKSDEQQKQDQQQPQQQARQDQSKPDQAPKQEQQKQEQAQQQAEQEKQQQQEQPQRQQAGQAAEEKPDQKEAQAMAAKPGQMTEQQAQQLLDSQKDDEKLLQFKPEDKPRDRARPLRDW